MSIQMDYDTMELTDTSTRASIFYSAADTAKWKKRAIGVWITLALVLGTGVAIAATSSTEANDEIVCTVKIEEQAPLTLRIDCSVGSEIINGIATLNP